MNRQEDQNPNIATVPVRSTPDLPPALPADTPADGPRLIGDLLNGFARYLPPSQPPLSEAQRQSLAARESARKLAQRRQAIEATLRKMVEAAGRRFADATLDNYQTATNIQVRIIEQLGDYIRDSRDSGSDEQGLVFFGPVGTGKDHLAFGVCRELVERHNLTVRWLNVQRWFSALRDRIGDEKRERESVELSVLTKPDVLVLSEVVPPFGDLGQYMANLLYLVVEERTARQTRTIVTLNVDSDAEARRRIGAPTWDRLCDNAGKIFCDWESYRSPAWTVNCGNK